MLRIFTDFDGPVMDVSERYYQVYRFCLEKIRRPGQTVQVLPKAEFWHLKRSQIPERQIGQRSGLDELQSQEFAHLRKQTVHTAPYLAYDRPYPAAIETLRRLQHQGIDVAVVTMRRVWELDDAFQRFDLGQFFSPERRFCLSDDYVKTTDVKDKPLLMQRAIAQLPPASETWMIGDTEADLIAAKTHGIKAIGVLSGIRGRSQLLQHEPDWIAATFTEAVDWVLERAPIRYAG